MGNLLSGRPGAGPCGIAETQVAHQPGEPRIARITLNRPKALNALNAALIEQRGRAALRGPTLFSGYWNAPEVNARDFRGGWFHMGDLFVRRADGLLDFVDRAKYLIKSGGENIYPAEIERVLLALPAVADAVVVRRRDERWGEVPVAFVAFKPGETMSADALAQRCRAELAGYKIPKEFRIVDVAEFPRSSTGKIQRHDVERRWLAG